MNHRHNENISVFIYRFGSNFASRIIVDIICGYSRRIKLRTLPVPKRLDLRSFNPNTSACAVLGRMVAADSSGWPQKSTLSMSFYCDRLDVVFIVVLVVVVVVVAVGIIAVWLRLPGWLDGTKME